MQQTNDGCTIIKYYRFLCYAIFRRKQLFAGFCCILIVKNARALPPVFQ